MLDIALAGAIRKGKAAEMVACDTALALAPALNVAELAEIAAALRADLAAADEGLLTIILRLSAG